MTNEIPTRSEAQRDEALKRANDVRSKRAQLKKDIKAGRKQALVILIDPPGWTLTMKVTTLLFAQPKFGRVKVNRTINAARVSTSKTVGGLSERQRGEIAEQLRSGKAPPPTAGLSGPLRTEEQEFALA
jgi:hypothetical protein